MAVFQEDLFKKKKKKQAATLMKFIGQFVHLEIQQIFIKLNWI